MRLAATAALLVIAAASALLLGGTAPFGRLALGLGLDRTASRLLGDPAWRGVALYRTGEFGAAAEAFRRTGPSASFNRGNALAFAGRYREAVAAYDAVIFRDPGDAEAHADRDLIAPLVEPVIGEDVSGGRTETVAAQPRAGDRAQREQAPAPRPLSEQDIVAMLRKLYTTKRQTGQSVVASRQWLATLPDEPGRYLKLRLIAEHARRVAAGLAVAQGGDPW
ncbi:Ca-activated chloride channel family protein [Tistlia consotensis]|uniref:Ca-activated chloride channel family protein n=1 Tax=Tistlia consotensis USBA 355 TaxID=560819 RepID=A0A1Y6CAF0_9PROT|nr:hypothetical protein [Tistlia consotensis]SMF51865.1 Ca-activated chloride channel family protein [Tistlia consotensis USBA 355]SNR83657.1 Ca-activated chloride channel family protein [Tistlia consotensis]